MKLLYTPNSPYSRVARVCALKQKAKLSFLEVGVREKADEILKYNPAAMVPTLLMDNGSFLTETRLICEFIDGLVNGEFVSPSVDLRRRHWEGLIGNFLDGVAVWVRELRRPAGEQSPGVIKLEQERAVRCLQHLEQQWDMETQSLDYSSTMLVSTIELIDTRLPLAWRKDHPRLVNWYEKLSQNPLLQQTAPQTV